MAYGIVYGLYDPVTDELRYIGQTRTSLRRRLVAHMTAARKSDRRHVLAWIRSLGLPPVIRILGEASAETRAKLSIALKGTTRSPASVLKQSIALRGRKLSDDHKRKISEARNRREFSRMGGL